MLLVSLVAGGVRAFGQETLTGLDVATKADQARRSKSEHQVLTMTLENSSGQKRVRTIEGWDREMSDDEEQRFSRFLEPADVKDTTLLTYDYEHKDDDIWLYLPALKKVKRILASNKSDYFMGSDFTYEDMENIDLVNWDYTLAAPDVLDGVECYVLDAVPNSEKEKSETAYSKLRYWIGKEDFLFRKVEYYDKKDRLSKRLTTGEIRQTSPTDPRKRAHRLDMQNLLTEHKTRIEMSKLELDVAVDDEVFSQRSLTR
jgi:outer membrane lipoprotein-sorting protein